MSYTKIFTLCFICIFLFFFGGKVSADFFVSSLELNNLGINYKHMKPISLSKDGKYFLIFESVHDHALKAKKITQSLKILTIENETIGAVERIDLPIVNIVNAVVNDLKNEVVIIADYGNKIVRFNFDTLRLDILFHYKKGVAGFKSGPTLICSNGQYYTTGWFYDKNHFWKGDYLVRLDIENNTIKKFTKAFNIGELFFVKNGFIKQFCYAGGKQIYFTFVSPKENRTTLMSLDAKKVSKKLDKGIIIVGLSGTHEHVFYAINKPSKKLIENYVLEVQGERNMFYQITFIGKSSFLFFRARIRCFF